MGILGRIKQSGGFAIPPAGQRGPSEEPVHSDSGDLIRVLRVKASTALRMFAVASLDDGICEAVVSNSKFSSQASQVKTENREKGEKKNERCLGYLAARQAGHARSCRCR